MQQSPAASSLDSTTSRSWLAGRSVRTSSRTVVALAPLLLILGGCAVSVADDRPAAPAVAEEETSSGGDAANETATFSVDGRTFSVTLASCMSTPDGDVLLHGAASELGSDVTGYFDGDITPYQDGVVGEFRLDIGSTGQFESSETFIAMGDSLGGEVLITPDGDGFIATAPSWSEQGTDLGQATLQFGC